MDGSRPSRLLEPLQGKPTTILEPIDDVLLSKSTLLSVRSDTAGGAQVEIQNDGEIQNDHDGNHLEVGVRPESRVSQAREEFEAMVVASIDRRQQKPLFATSQLLASPDHVDRHGVWPSRFHAFCVLLTLNVSTIEYMYGPRLSARYGGIVFFIVLALLSCFTSIPMFHLEMLVGRLTLKAPTGFVHQLAPFFRGLGFAMMWITSVRMTYWLVGKAWLLLYLYYVPHRNVLWNTCHPVYNSVHCFTVVQDDLCTMGKNQTWVYYNFTCVAASEYCLREGYRSANATHCLRKTSKKRAQARWHIDQEDDRFNSSKSTDEDEPLRGGRRLLAQGDFFKHFVRASYNEESSPATKELSSRAFRNAYLLCWLALLLVSSSVRLASWLAVFVTITAPLFSLLVLSRVVALPGALNGVKQFFVPDSLSDLNITTTGFWADIVKLMFLNSSIGLGVIPATVSRDHFSRPTMLFAAGVVLLETTFGMINAMLFFAVLGELRHTSAFMYNHVSVLESDSRALLFVAFASVSHMMPRPDIWGFVYFLSMFLHLLCATALCYLSLVFCLADAFPQLRKLPVVVVSALVYIPSLALAAIIILAKNNSNSWSFEDTMTLEWNIVALVFQVMLGLKLSSNEFLQAIKRILHVDLLKCKHFYIAVWLVAGPVLLIINLVHHIALTHRQPSQSDEPTWMKLFGYLYSAAPVLLIVGGVAYTHRTTEFSQMFITQPEFLGSAEEVRAKRSAMGRRPSALVSSQQRFGGPLQHSSSTRRGNPSQFHQVSSSSTRGGFL